jgi:hypothetical protein
LFIANWLSPGRHRPPENQIAVMDSNATAPSMADLLEERFVDFAVGVIHVANRLDHTLAGRHIAGQIIRSGTSAADFIHKLRIAIKEMNETAIWLRIIMKSGVLPREDLFATAEECDALRRILGASLRTARLRASGNGGRADASKQ